MNFSSSVTVKKKERKYLARNKSFDFEKLDFNHCRGQRVNLQVDLITKK